MKLLFKQRFFSWFDSYDIYYEDGSLAYNVRGQFSLGHCLKIYDPQGCEIGTVLQKIFVFMPQFELYLGDIYMGCIRREFSFFKPRYHIDCNGWHIEGDIFGWDYRIVNDSGSEVAYISKMLWNFTDTYSIDVRDPKDALSALMFVLAIDAEKCSNN